MSKKITMSPKDIILILVLLLLAAGWGYYTYVYMPMQTEIVELKVSNEDLALKKTQYTAQIGSVTSIEELYKTNELLIQEKSNKLRPYTQQYATIKEFEYLLLSAGVDGLVYVYAEGETEEKDLVPPTEEEKAALKKKKKDEVTDTRAYQLKSLYYTLAEKEMDSSGIQTLKELETTISFTTTYYNLIKVLEFVDAHPKYIIIKELSYAVVDTVKLPQERAVDFGVNGDLWIENNPINPNITVVMSVSFPAYPLLVDEE